MRRRDGLILYFCLELTVAASMNLTATSTTENGRRKVLLCQGESCIEIEGDSALIVYFLSLNALCLLCISLWGLRKIFVMIRAWCQNFLAHRGQLGENVIMMAPTQAQSVNQGGQEAAMPLMIPPPCRVPSCPSRL